MQQGQQRGGQARITLVDVRQRFLEGTGRPSVLMLVLARRVLLLGARLVLARPLTKRRGDRQNLQHLFALAHPRSQSSVSSRGAHTEIAAAGAHDECEPMCWRWPACNRSGASCPFLSLPARLLATQHDVEEHQPQSFDQRRRFLPTSAPTFLSLVQTPIFSLLRALVSSKYSNKTSSS